MVEHLMSATHATAIVVALTEAGVDASIGGGWAIDALLGEQTREHEDLDLWVPAGNFEHLITVLVKDGIDRLYPWGGDRPWNFVVHDGSIQRVDLHLYELLPDKYVHYGSVRGGDVFPASALYGRGSIAGTVVRCETPEWSLRCHAGYEPRPVDHHDVPLLCRRFGFDLPAPYC